ncbi:hypothetical protein [Pseudoalteromonas phenolica]|nr:hypothetical protein [Pseudoalteromonas phenolica]
MIQTAAACSNTQPRLKKSTIKKPSFSWQSLFAVCGQKLSMAHMCLYK